MFSYSGASSNECAHRNTAGKNTMDWQSTELHECENVKMVKMTIMAFLVLRIAIEILQKVQTIWTGMI